MAAGDDSQVSLETPTGNADTRLTASGDQRQVVVLGNAGDRVVGVEPRAALNVNLGPNTLFVDQWSGVFDTTDRWTVSSGATPTFNGGFMVMPATVSTFNVIRSKGNMPYTLGYLYNAMGMKLEASAATGAGRFWGFGNQATTPAVDRLVQDGVGFEIDQATGNLLAVTYQNGTRTTIATLTRPTDGATHRYAIHFRVTDCSWYIDGLDVPVATVSFPNVQVQELPVLIVRQNAASFTGTPVFDNIAVAIGDTSRMGNQIQDGRFPWRKALVDDYGALRVEQFAAAAHTIGSTTGTTPATVGQVGRPVRVSANVAVANSVVIAAPAAGTRIYVTSIQVANEGATFTVVRLYAGTSAPAAIGAFAAVNDVYDFPVAATGGGAGVNFPDGGPWPLPVATALSLSSSAATTFTATVNYYVAL